MLKYVASGVFGKEAFTSDSSMIFWGLFFHYVIAISFTFFFFWLAKTFPGILKVKLLTAVGYGIFMWCVTQFLVIPLSKIPTPAATLSGAAMAISILIVCMGIPLTWIAAKQVNTNK